jgi:hypothetical protein
VLGLVGSPLSIAAAGPSSADKVAMRYDLRPGTRLVYREVFERHAKSTEGKAGWESNSRIEWTAQIVVAGVEDGAYVTGFQRNRTGSELLSYTEKGKDRLEQQREIFDEWISSIPARFAEGNRVTERGRALLPWSMARERNSEMLPGLHEIEPLPDVSVGPGDTWTGTFPLGLDFRVLARETVDDESCLRIEGRNSRESFRMDFSFCPGTGAVVRAEFEGSYWGVQARLTDRWRIELVDVVRDEAPAAWLADPELRIGALAALAVSETPADTESLHALIEADDDDEALRRVLGLAYRQRVDPRPVEQLRRLAIHDDRRVRALAVRLLESHSTRESRSVIERALEDDDYFVREAALAWVRARLPDDARWSVASVTEARERFDSLAERPLPHSDRPSEDGTLPQWLCEENPGWPARLKQSLAFASQPPGTTLRRMTSPGFEGWPYAVHVPEDYRGDEPRPLLVYLAGGHGRAMLSVMGSQSTVRDLGYLVLYPQSEGYWWNPKSRSVVTTLVDEVLRKFNVDTNRVYLTGFSNGGTGTLFFATWWPHRLAAAASLMGAGAYPPEAEAPLLLNVTDLPLLFAHGVKDEVIAAPTTRDTVRQLLDLDPGSPVETHMLKGRGHDLWLGNDDDLTIPFFQLHAREVFPRSIEFQIRDLEFPRHYWVEILEKGNGVAEVRAQISGDNTIIIETSRVKRLRLLLRRELLPRPGPLRVRINGKQVFSTVLEPDCDLLVRSMGETADPFLAYSSELTFDVKR